jgi:hypothetical protein
MGENCGTAPALPSEYRSKEGVGQLDGSPDRDKVYAMKLLQSL